MKFFQKLFPPSFCSFLGGFLNQLSKYNSFHLQIRYHTADDVLIASNETASATHVRTRHHTADKRVHRPRRTRFVLVRRRTLLALETSAFRAGDKQVENVRSNSSYTHTASYQRLPNRTFVEMIASHNYSPSNTGAIHVAEIQTYLDAQRRLPWH